MNEKPKLGTCDVANHANGWVTIAPGVGHERLAGCVNWREPVASPQATREPIYVVTFDGICYRCRECLAQAMNWSKIIHDDDCSSAAQAAAGPTPCPNCDEAAKYAYSDATTPGFFSPFCSKHKPSEGTTPQAERRTYQQADCPKCHERITVEVLGLGRAVAPVETPEKPEPVVLHEKFKPDGSEYFDLPPLGAPVETRPLTISGSDSVTFGASSEDVVDVGPIGEELQRLSKPHPGDSSPALSVERVQTRLTAEQFWLKYNECDGELIYQTNNENAFKFAEAFRDKSEALKATAKKATAEQFVRAILKPDPNHPNDDTFWLHFPHAVEEVENREFWRKHLPELMAEFADNSEAALREELKLWKRSMCVLYELIEDRECPTPEAAIGLVTSSVAGLREEIERLKTQKVGCPSCGCAFTVQGEDLHRGEKAVALLERMLTAEAEAAALRERERWIPWGERMPNPNDRVQILMESGKVTVGAWSGVEWFDGDESFSRLETYGWKALSAAPERGKGENNANY